MKKAKYYLALLAVVAVLTAGIGQAMAYFTTYTDAAGGFSVWLGDDTEIKEEDTMYNWDKILTITNNDGEPVFVRAKVFYAPDDLEISVTRAGEANTKEGIVEETSGAWLSKDDYDAIRHSETKLGIDEKEDNSTCYYYYTEPLEKGVSAWRLNVHIGNIPKDVVEGDKFSVIVVYESVPVFYDEKGNAYADWTSKLVTKWEDNEEQEGGGE